jgi:undecaprenyl diphosphate synthase
MSSLSPSPVARYFTEHELDVLRAGDIPRHIAVIPDGNRRWAQQQALGCHIGHQRGGQTLITIIQAAKELGIKVLSCYCFSTENWSRPQLEVHAFMWLFNNFLLEQCPLMVSSGIRVGAIGDTEQLPGYLQRTLAQVVKATAHCRDFDVVLALNYGSRNEICRAVRRLITDPQQKLLPEQISEELLASYLDTAPWGDPDLLIRASGEHRLSNYLLWQLSYTEIYVSDVLWPDFTAAHLLEALLDFQTRQRRLGKL